MSIEKGSESERENLRKGLKNVIKSKDVLISTMATHETFIHRPTLRFINSSLKVY